MRLIEYIYIQLAADFGSPCNYTPQDEIMSADEQCKKDCGTVSIAECWKRYFERMYNNVIV